MKLRIKPMPVAIMQVIATGAFSVSAMAPAMAQQAAAEQPPLKRARPDFGGSCPPDLAFFCLFGGYITPSDLLVGRALHNFGVSGWLLGS